MPAASMKRGVLTEARRRGEAIRGAHIENYEGKIWNVEEVTHLIL